MKRTICFLIGILIILFVSGCEVDNHIAKYRYTQDNLSGKKMLDIENYYFEMYPEKQLILESLDFPSVEDERKYLSLRNGVKYTLPDSAQIEIKKIIDSLLMNNYRINYLYLNDYSDTFELMCDSLMPAIKASNYFENKYNKAIEYKSDINIERLYIYGNAVSYQTSNQQIFRVKIDAQLSVQTCGDRSIENIPSNYNIGMNTLEIYLYLVKEDDAFKIAAWRETTTNPLRTTWFTSIGIYEDIKNSVDLSLCNNNYEGVYWGKKNAGSKRIDNLQNKAILGALDDYFDDFFSIHSRQGSDFEHINKYTDTHSINSQYLAEWSEYLQKLDLTSEYMGFIEIGDPIQKDMFVDSSGNEYYEMFLRIGYEMNSANNSDYVCYGQTDIPIGSFTGLVNVLVGYNEQGEIEVDNWTLTSFMHKTCGFKL